jgi:DNA-binding NtrC family response regulator
MPLARTFLKKFAHRYGASCRGFDDALQTWMEAYTWPGNVRELQTFVESAVLKCQGEDRLKLEKFMLSE